MRVSAVAVSRIAAGWELSATVQPDSTNQALRLWFRIEGAGAAPPPVGDCFAAALVTPCMFEGEDLHIAAPLSAPLAANLDRAQEILANWYDYLRPIRIIGSDHYRSSPAQPSSQSVACCFSGGVDSWYSLLKHRPAVTHLLLIRGFDIGTDNDALWSEAKRRAREVTGTLGKELVTVETNLREIADKRRCSWGRRCDSGDFWQDIQHGSALAAVALTLQNVIGRLIVPATHVYRLLRPWGSSPLLDPLFSTEALSVDHDGCEASRADKVRNISGCDIALRHLRVCPMNFQAYNCCACEKCLRTMMALRVCNALDRATSFPDPLDLRAARRLIIAEHLVPRYREVLEEAVRANDRELIEACRILARQRFSAARALRTAIRDARTLARHRLPRPIARVLVRCFPALRSSPAL